MLSHQRLLKRAAKERGMVALEVALGLPVLLLAIFLWCEICFVSYISAMLDYAIAETSRHVRTYPHKNYAQEFARLIHSSDTLWRHFIDTDNLILKTWYQRDLRMLNESHYHGPPGSSQEGNLIAVYQVSYPYRPLFSRLTFGLMQPPVLMREVIAIQEYER